MRYWIIVSLLLSTVGFPEDKPRPKVVDHDRSRPLADSQIAPIDLTYFRHYGGEIESYRIRQHDKENKKKDRDFFVKLFKANPILGELKAKITAELSSDWAWIELDKLQKKYKGMSLRAEMQIQPGNYPNFDIALKINVDAKGFSGFGGGRVSSTTNAADVVQAAMARAVVNLEESIAERKKLNEVRAKELGDY